MMKVYRKGFFSKIGKLFGMQDIEIGHESFDLTHTVQGNNPSAIQALLNNHYILAAIDNLPKATVEIKHRDPLSSRKIAEGEHILSLYTVGVIKDIDTYREKLELAIMIMDQLEQLGLASEEEPQTALYNQK